MLPESEVELSVIFPPVSVMFPVILPFCADTSVTRFDITDNPAAVAMTSITSFVILTLIMTLRHRYKYINTSLRS